MLFFCAQLEADVTVSEALSASLAGLDLEPQDQAAVALAKRYATVLDVGSEDVVKVGPAFLAVLSALGMTPAGRAAVLGKGGDPRGGQPQSKADELRARRAAREHAS